MQTYSHYLLTAVLRKKLQKAGKTDPGKAILIGSVMPDVLLILITIGFLIQRKCLTAEQGPRVWCDATYNELYFNNPWWISSHNLFHAPFMLILYGLIGYWGLKQGKKWGAPLLWFSIGAGFHTTIDILTHVDDGPLLFYPFDWQTRFTAPISYWDPKHGGRIFAILEHLLDILLIIFLIKRRGGKTGL